MAEDRVRAKKSLGQNFLVDPNLQRKIVAAVEASPDDCVVEIGPGQGALTKHLMGAVGHLTLIELDDGLVARLQPDVDARADTELIHQDVLTVDLPGKIADWANTRVVGNIPYNITTPILFHLLERPRPRSILLMVQREVADRIVASPGSKTYGALAVGVQSVAKAEYLFGVPNRAFRPVPRVESAVVRITPFDPPPLSLKEERSLRVLTRAVFQWRRKQLQKTLREHPDLGPLPREVVERIGRDLDLDLSRRPETLSPERLMELARAVVCHTTRD